MIAEISGRRLKQYRFPAKLQAVSLNLKFFIL